LYLDKPLTRESFFDHISSKSRAHKVNIKIAIDWFEKFCLGKFDGKSLSTILADSMEQKNKDPQRHSQNLFSLLQDFINYLGDNGQEPSTVRVNLNLVKNYLNWYGFEIYSEAVKSRLNFPKKIEEQAYPMTIENIKKILDNSIEKRKILYLFLSCTGMRISETLQLRKRDLESKKFDRIVVNIAGKYTKTGKPRKTFVSKEVEKYLIPLIAKVKDDDLIFGTNENPLKSKHNEEENFARVREKAELDNLKYDNGIHKITLHSFRSWFVTKCNRVDSDFGNSLAGHQKYMKRYNRFTESELCDLFKKAENSLSIFERIDENQEKKIDVLSKDLENLRQENQSMKNERKQIQTLLKESAETSEALKNQKAQLDETINLVKSFSKEDKQLIKEKITSIKKNKS